jgi:hypothetical protein
MSVAVSALPSERDNAILRAADGHPVLPAEADETLLEALVLPPDKLLPKLGQTSVGHMQLHSHIGVLNLEEAEEEPNGLEVRKKG